MLIAREDESVLALVTVVVRLQLAIALAYTWTSMKVLELFHLLLNEKAYSSLGERSNVAHRYTDYRFSPSYRVRTEINPSSGRGRQAFIKAYHMKIILFLILTLSLQWKVDSY